MKKVLFVLIGIIIGAFGTTFLLASNDRKQKCSIIFKGI